MLSQFTGCKPRTRDFEKLKNASSILRGEDRYELVTLTHGGVFSIWDVSKRERLRRVRIADVEYLGGKE